MVFWRIISPEAAKILNTKPGVVTIARRLPKIRWSKLKHKRRIERAARKHNRKVNVKKYRQGKKKVRHALYS